MTHWVRSGIYTAAGAVFIADRLTKYFVIKWLALGQSIKVVPGVFHITLVHNRGAAFGIMQGCSVFFVIFSIAVIAAALLVISRMARPDAILAVSLALILGGSAGNLVDRFKFGYVIDFLDFRVWPVFNIADSCITIGLTLMIIRVVFRRRS